MSWNFGETRNLFNKLRTQLGHFHVVPITPKSSLNKITLTIAKLQQLSELKQCGDEISCVVDNLQQ